MKTVVFLSKHKYPSGDASSKRNICLGRYFYENDHDVFFVGMGSTKYKEVVNFGPYKIISLRKFSSKFVLFKILNHLFVKRKIKNFVKRKFKFASIFIVDPIFYSIIKNDKFFKQRKIIYSAVEYYSPCNYKLNGIFSKNYYENIRFNKKLNKNEGSVISISSYLKDNFASRNIKTIRIPFVIDSKISLSEFDLNKKYDNNKQFIYCGNPRRKDLLAEMIRGFLLLPKKDYYKCKVIICGVNFDWLERYFKKDEIEVIKQVFDFKGYVPYDKVVEYYKNSTFSILLRPFDERYAKAGFPTKITEALEYGVVPITNFTSDLRLYLIDDTNSVKVNGEDRIAFMDAISRAIKLDDQKVTELKVNARELCVTKLDIKEYYKELDSIVK